MSQTLLFAIDLARKIRWSDDAILLFDVLPPLISINWACDTDLRAAFLRRKPPTFNAAFFFYSLI